MSVRLLQYCVIGLPMDKDIRVLEKIGLQEVCKKTHIEVKQLEYMINNEYEKLNKINTLGFVKILSREYKLDLSQWLEGFHDYWAEHKSDEEMRKEKIFIRAKSDTRSKKLAWIFLFLMFIAGIFGAMSLFKVEIDVMGIIDKVKTQTVGAVITNTGFQNAPVVQEAATSLGVKVEERVVETNSTNTTIEAVVVSVETNQSVSLVEANSTNATVNPPLVSNLPSNTAIITPTRKIWIGQIALDTYKRHERTTDQNVSIDLTQNQLIKTGNGYFKLSYDGSVEDFMEQGSTRFLVENGTLKKISEEVFVQLNRGKNW